MSASTTEVSAELVAQVMSAELSDAVHAAAEGAADAAHAAGVAENECEVIFRASVEAATRTLEARREQSVREGGADTVLKPTSRTFSRESARIESTLARAIKRNAIRVIELFRDWDEDRNGLLDKKEFRAGLRATGIGASIEEIDALFERWDKDSSGAIDYNELNRALKRRLMTMRDELDETDDAAAADGTSLHLLGRDRERVAAVKQAKAQRDEVKARKALLSPRSQQLQAAREAAQAARHAQMTKVWREEEETGRRWTAARWLTSRHVAQEVADALQLPHLGEDASTQFQYVKNLSSEQVETLLSSAGMSGLVPFVIESVASLANQCTGSAEQLNEKFSTTAKFQMTYGSLSLFYGGLESLLGPPKMYKGPSHEEKTLFNTMEYEHTVEKDAKVSFTSPNKTTTTTETEWAVVCTPQSDVEYPERERFREHHSEWCRVVQPLPAMLRAMEEQCNAKLRAASHSELILEELVGGRLYTGPMYIKYNTVLRSKTADPVITKVCRELTKGNTYTTTIHAINSCVIKLSKLTKAGKVWRGIKDATLPKEFWTPNEMGVRGGIEYGFSSTTTDREQALLFANGRESTIFEMQMGMVDRGADLTWLSQYPHEQEVLLPPLTGIEALNLEVDGSMLVIHSRLSLNLASHTLEQVLSRRRKMLMDMVAGIELELRDALGEDKFAIGNGVLKRALAYGPLTRDPEWFNDDENFAQVMQQTLELQQGIVKEIGRLSVATNELNLRGWKLRGSARVLLLAGWLYYRSSLAASAGAHETVAIDVRDAQLSSSEAQDLATLMRKQPKLTALDVRNNDSMGKDGAEALATCIESYRGIVGVTARSVCGVTPSSSTLEVPRTLGPVAARLACAELRTFVFAAGVSAVMGEGRTRRDKPAVLNRRGAYAATDWLPLLWAASENHVELARTLLDLGTDINEQQPINQVSAKYSALHVAAQKGCTEIVALLLERGADRSLRDKHNNSALMLAEKKKHAEIIAMLSGDVRMVQA